MKAILVIDMPEKCDGNCPCFQSNIYDEFFCGAADYKEIDFSKNPRGPDWCPLIPFNENALKIVNKDYVIYRRGYLYANLFRELELDEKVGRQNESNNSN